jgi:hypothetical protein
MMLVYFMAVWSFFRAFVISYGHLVYFPPFWYILNRFFGMLYQDTSGNPAPEKRVGKTLFNSVSFPARKNEINPTTNDLHFYSANYGGIFEAYSKSAQVRNTKSYFLLLALAASKRDSFSLLQGCQMVSFLTKNPNLGKFGRVLQRKI